MSKRKAARVDKALARKQRIKELTAMFRAIAELLIAAALVIALL